MTEELAGDYFELLLPELDNHHQGEIQRTTRRNISTGVRAIMDTVLVDFFIDGANEFTDMLDSGGPLFSGPTEGRSYLP